MEEEQLEHMPDRDAAADLPGKDIFNDRLTQALSLAKRSGQSLAVMFVKFHRLKLINDNLGQHIGDQLIQEAARRVKQALRKSDSVTRPGGNEFMVLLPEIMHVEDATVVARKIFDSFNLPFILDRHEIFINCSIGISVHPDDGDNAKTLIKNAYTALHHANALGKNEMAFYSSRLNDLAFEKMLLENNLRLALERDQFVLHYQPQIDLASRRICGVEALVRWQRPDVGLVYPGDFIRVMEETGFICQLGEWVLRTACRQNKAWQQSGLRPMRVAVNVSAQQFHQQDLVGLVRSVLNETGLEPCHLELELTETVFMRRIESVVETLRALRTMGLHISIDDFGTGYSSLSYLKMFPVNKLKMVEPFVSCLSIEKPDDMAIASMIVSMAHSLNMKVIAEGVEESGNLELLRSIRCDEMQGNLISHPVPAEEIPGIVREEKNLMLRAAADTDA